MEHCRQTGPAVADPSERELEEARLAQRMSRIGYRLLVLSGKGGVGKSTVAASLAVTLAADGNQVGLLDVDVHGPSIPRLTGLAGQRLEVDEAGIRPLRTPDGLEVMSVGFLLDNRADPVIWRGPRKYAVIRQFLTDVNWGSLDHLVIDSPPGTGDEPLAVAELAGGPSGAVIVTTPQELALDDVRRCVTFCRSVSVPVLGIVENMSPGVCPHCGSAIPVFGAGGGERLSREMGVAFLGSIPLDPGVPAGGDAGWTLSGPTLTEGLRAAFEHVRLAVLARIHEETFGAAGAEIPDRPEQQHTQESIHMKIAIPTAGSRLCAHFGHCETFALLDVNMTGKTITGVTHLNPPPHEPGVLPRWLREQGADLVIAGGMGQRAQSLFRESGIGVIVGAPSAAPEEVATAYMNGELQTGDNLCDH